MSAGTYRAWQRDSVGVNGRTLHVATKPGVFAHGESDEAALLLAEQAVVDRDSTVAYLNCGSGLFGIVAAAVARDVLLTDRNVLSFEAATRSVVANALSNVRVELAQGLPHAEPSTFDVVGIRVPHERLAQLQLLLDAFRALRVGGACYIAGAGNEGIKPAARAMQRLFGNAMVLSTRSGHRLVRAMKVAASPVLPEEFTNPLLGHDVFHHVVAELRGRAIALATRPGVFSWEHADEATTLLAGAMQTGEGRRVLDLGCGAGPLGTLAALTGSAAVCMVDADSEAVRCAARTAADNGVVNVRTIASDVALAVDGERFDVVLTNPPFHVGKTTSLDVPMQFIGQAWDVLVPGGELQLVANRTLPYERAIAERFGNIGVLHDGARFKVLRAVRLAE